MGKWTPAELNALHTTVSYEQFAAKTGGSRSYDSWEVKRRRIDRSVPVVGVMGPFELQRAIANNVKLARQVIRLRHSIEADDELADAIPRIKNILVSQAQTGRVSGLSFDELRLLIYGQ